jgi:hypothetical protein
MITNINKAKYVNLVENLRKDRGVINKALSKLTIPKKQGLIILGKPEQIEPQEKKVQSKSGNGEYVVRVLGVSGKIITTVYSIFPDYIVVWPIEVLLGDEEKDPYIILIKQHLIQRYAERYLKVEENLEGSLSKFIDVFCMRKDPVMIKKSETDKVDGLMCRIKEGALLGYSYKVSPRILRFNTFVSDEELEKTNRKDQESIRRGGIVWKKVVQ